jgi:hemerythrin-like domain-containing protein
MQPRGPLMTEHRLIERMISSINKEIIKIEKVGMINQSFIAVAVDFLQIYADRTHHGKEEEILFRDLSRKKLSDNDNLIMNELIQEHIVGRTTTADIVKSAAAYQKGDKAALPSVTLSLKKFVDFYPKHIEKEDKVFFPSSMTYFSEQEQKSMLEEFREFDRKMIHEKYKFVIESIENQEAIV